MDDLTAHLADVLQRGHNTTEDPLDDPFGFGDDASELPPQGLDRYDSTPPSLLVMHMPPVLHAHTAGPGRYSGNLFTRLCLCVCVDCRL